MLVAIYALKPKCDISANALHFGRRRCVPFMSPDRVTHAAIGLRLAVVSFSRSFRMMDYRNVSILLGGGHHVSRDHIKMLMRYVPPAPMVCGPALNEGDTAGRVCAKSPSGTVNCLHLKATASMTISKLVTCLGDEADCHCSSETLFGLK